MHQLSISVWVLVTDFKKGTMKKKEFLIGLGIFLLVICYGQPDKDSVVPFIKTGYGYINDELMVSGNNLWSEAGIKLSNNYTFSFNCKFGETINSKGNFSSLGIETAELISTEKIFTLFMGYDFLSRNQKHSFMPQVGPFYSVQNIEYINYADATNLFIRKNSFKDIGVALELCYLYNFKSKISIGFNCSCYLAYQMGPLYYTISPLIALRL